MEKFKVKVRNADESKEAQELFFELGYYWAYKNLGKKPLLSKKDVYLFAESNGVLGTGVKENESFFNDWRGKEITIQDLKDMVVLKSESINDKIATAEVARQESKSIDATLAERQSQYGCFEDVAFVTENIMSTLAKVRSNGLRDLPHTHRMALYMIASKMARIVNGDFNHLDSWHDIGGYSKLIEDLIGDNNEL